MELLISPVGKRQLLTEIQKLPDSDLLMRRGHFEVYLSQLGDRPTLLREIGRLREETFRSVGEGTGKALDIDEFDRYYHNLFIWDRQAGRIVGGYRMGPGREIVRRRGPEQFYLHSLFDVHPAAQPLLAQSVELGRSYIVEDYQRGYLPFFLLWRGILCFLLQHPEYRYLIGPVSISKYYSGRSKSLIVAFVKRYFFDDQWAAYFHPRQPFEPDLATGDLEHLLDRLQGDRLADLENLLDTIEPDHLKVPVLLKQYTKLNARFISFNIDPKFSDALDGLMLLDLKNLPPETLRLLNEK
ncbi:MAG: GNAT family N-acyltransferase [Bacteroidota bacterium]